MDEQENFPDITNHNGSSSELNDLRTQIRRLHNQLNFMDQRLARLEQLQGISAPIPEPETILQPVEGVEASPVVEAQLEAVAAEEVEAHATVPVEPEIATPRKPREWEQVFGGNWLARIGIIAVIIGIAFFIKFTIDNAWLNPILRAVVISLPGFLLIGAGYYWRKKFPTFSQALSGGGMAVLYLAVFAAFVVFQILNIYVAIILLMLVSVGCAALALNQNSMALAIISIVGAFAGSFIVGVTGKPAADAPLLAGTNITLLIYVILVDIGVIILSTFRNWRWFTLLALFGSIMEYSFWYTQFGTKTPLAICEGGLTVLFLIFVGATTLYHFIWKKEPRPFDYALMVINAIAYYGTSYGLMRIELHDWMGAFTLLLALFYGGLTYAAWRRNPENSRLRYFLLGIALVFLTIAIPVQLGEKAWTTIAWAAEGTVLIWLGLKFKISLFKYFGYVVFFITTIRLLIFDTWVNKYEYQPVLNERVLAFMFGIIAMGLAGYLIWREREPDENTPKTPSMFPVFLIGANLLSMWIVAAEVISYKSTFNSPLIVVFPLVMMAVTALYHLAWRRKSGTFDFIMVVINALFYLCIAAGLWKYFRAWMGLYYLVPALCYGLLAYFAIFTGKIQGRLFGLFSMVVALIFLTTAIPVQFENRIWTTIGWTIEFMILFWLSFRLKLSICRYFSYVVFGAMGIRLLFFDTQLDMRWIAPFINERSLAFLLAIAAIYLMVFLILRRHKEQVKNPVFLIATLLVIANFYTIWVLSFSIWDFFSKQITAELIPAQKTIVMNAQKFSLTALWALYAVIALVLGIMKRWRLVRLWALGLLMIAIIKVFAYDIWTLEEVYRIGALVGLGFLLLLSAYLYQRYSKRIITFVAPEKKEVVKPLTEAMPQIQVKQQPIEKIQTSVVSTQGQIKTTRKPVIAGILCIIAGFTPVIISVIILIAGSLKGGEITGAIILLSLWCILGIMAIVGGIFAIKRTRWEQAFIRSICATVSCFVLASWYFVV